MHPISAIMRVMMTDAMANVKLATLTMSAFRPAKLRGEEDGADNSAGRAADFLPSVIQSSQASEAALVRAQAEVQAQENLRWQQIQDEAEAAARAQDRARVRQALREAREAVREADDEDDGGQKSQEDSPDRANERRAGRKPTEPGVEPLPQAGDAKEKGVVYTHLGEVKPKSQDKKLNVTA